jgi:preprotein translocase subunit SecG
VGVVSAVILIFHVLLALGLCGGAAFGSGSSGSLFGASGSANFLSRSTAILATLFFLSSLGLTWFSMQKPHGTSIMDRVPTGQPAAPAAPAVPPAPAGAGAAGQPEAAGQTQGGPPEDSKAGSIPK